MEWNFYDHNNSTWLFGVTLCFVTMWYFLRRSGDKLPPGPPSLPIVGSLPFLGSKNILKAFARISEKYGDIFTIDLGAVRYVVLNGYDVIREALSKQGSTFTGRPQDFFTKHFAKNKGIVAVTGPIWKEHRHFINRSLKNFGLGRKSMEDIVVTEINHLSSELRSNVGIPLNPHNTLRNATANIITALAFSHRHDYDDKEFRDVMKAIEDLGEALGGNSLIPLFPYLRFVPGDLFGFKAVSKNLAVLDSQFEQWIDESRRNMDRENPRNIIDCYLMEMEKRQREHGVTECTFTDSQLLRLVMDVFGAGTDTSSTTLTWSLLYMIRNPHIQQRVQAEIDDIVGSCRLPAAADRNRMPFTEAVISETQRIADVSPLSLPRAPITDAHLRGFVIPKGTSVLVNLHSVLTDERVWSNPGAFNPDRFLDSKGLYKEKEEFIPFSLGKRVCIGEGLARLELFLIFASILQQFTVRSPEGAPVPDTEGIIGVMYHPKPFEIILEER